MGPGLLPVVGTFQLKSPISLSSVFCGSQWTCSGHCHLDSEGDFLLCPLCVSLTKRGFFQIKGLQLRGCDVQFISAPTFRRQQYHTLVCTAQGPKGVTGKIYFSSVLCTPPLPASPMATTHVLSSFLGVSHLLPFPVCSSLFLLSSSLTLFSPVSSSSFLFSTILSLLNRLCSV